MQTIERHESDLSWQTQSVHLLQNGRARSVGVDDVMKQSKKSTYMYTHCTTCIARAHSPSTCRHLDSRKEGLLDFEVFDQRSVVAVHNVGVFAVFTEVLQHFLDAVDAVQDRLNNNTTNSKYHVIT